MKKLFGLVLTVVLVVGLGAFAAVGPTSAQTYGTTLKIA